MDKCNASREIPERRVGQFGRPLPLTGRLLKLVDSVVKNYTKSVANRISTCKKSLRVVETRVESTRSTLVGAAGPVDPCPGVVPRAVSNKNEPTDGGLWCKPDTDEACLRSPQD